MTDESASPDSVAELTSGRSLWQAFAKPGRTEGRQAGVEKSDQCAGAPRRTAYKRQCSTWNIAMAHGIGALI